MFSRDGTLSHEMHRVLRHGMGECITAPLPPPSAPEQGSDLVCLHLALTGRRDLRKRRVGLRAEARRTWPWWRTAVDLRAGPGENRDPRGTCEIVAGAAFEEALVRTYLALIEPAMKEVKTRWIVNAS